MMWLLYIIGYLVIGIIVAFIFDKVVNKFFPDPSYNFCSTKEKISFFIFMVCLWPFSFIGFLMIFIMKMYDNKEIKGEEMYKEVKNNETTNIVEIPVFSIQEISRAELLDIE